MSKLINFIYQLFLFLVKIIWIPLYRLFIQSDTDLIIESIENKRKSR